ncbi:HAD family phosphatase [Actinospica durhamensis]|uniref:HAD family phosphatase n=1 Tax=Actinospica durhamensis TaxID=1508375 RepID=A0A941ET10_9ACTN|nr:HAD family phosphatase [Actinospica durhamensis]MBR7835938.1 HAD family phosphatase [Actinospica durhamensis]
MPEDTVAARPAEPTEPGDQGPAEPAESATPVRPIRVAGAVDLHADVPELVVRLGRAVRRDDALDAYLGACALAQIMEDRAEGTDTFVRRLTAMLSDGGLLGRAVRLVARLQTARRLLFGGRSLRTRREGARALVSLLADDVVGGRGIDEQARALIQSAAGWASAADAALARPPSCFRSFDQHPRDCAELARRFAQRHPDRGAPVVVLGVRTSGGYLAPLIAAFLRRQGYDAEAATVRPGGPLPRRALAGLRAGAQPGRVVVVDDPPSSGAALAKAVRAARACGFAAAQVVTLYASFAEEAAGALPREVPRIVLGAKDWHIRKLLSPQSVAEFVRETFADHDILEVVSDEPGLPTRAGHLGVRATVWLRSERGVHRLDLRAEGVGTGYLGRHAYDVASRLPGTTPRVYALRDAVMLRAAGEPLAAAAVPLAAAADYVAARRERLRVARDRSALLGGRQPAWEVAGRIFAAGFGRLGPAVRPLLIDPPLRELTAAKTPCLTDGTTVLTGWETTPDGSLYKSDFDDGCFSHLDLACYDAGYDLAGAAVGQPESESALLARYEARTGEWIAPARWCVYRSVQAWNLRRAADGAASDAEPVEAIRAQTRALQELFGRLYLGDLAEEPAGPWVVLDVDGVLELDFGGVPAPTIASMTALRALRAHGYRVLLATGRSLPEVRDRCVAYRLAGGVAEYGAVATDAHTGSVYDLVTAANWNRQRRVLMEELAAFPEVRLDPRYRWAVRAQGLRAALGTLPGTVAVPGDAQTDFIPAGVGKAAGVRALLALLGEHHAEVALAVGDSAMDLGILRMAKLGLAPGHAGRALRDEGVRCTRAPYQAGLAQAAGRLIGHRPGSCAQCAPPDLTPGERLITSLVSVGERGRLGLVPALLGLAGRRIRPGARISNEETPCS